MTLTLIVIFLPFIAWKIWLNSAVVFCLWRRSHPQKAECAQQLFDIFFCGSIITLVQFSFPFALNSLPYITIPQNQHIQLTPAYKNQHFLKSGKIGSCILGYVWQFRLSRFSIRLLIFMKEITDCWLPEYITFLFTHNCK